MTLDPAAYREIVTRALAEDLGSGDVTTGPIVSDEARATAVLVAKSDCVVAGLPVAEEVCRQVDARLRWHPHLQDGARCAVGDTIARLEGPAAGVLIAERTLLNFLQRLSGIATATRHCVEAVAGRATILDTRKTTPTLRALEKYAVRCGGGRNHRFGLFDAVLIKDNHIRVAGGVGEAVRRVRAWQDARGTSLPIQVETQSLDQVDDALAAGADLIMLDNLDASTMGRAVATIAGRAKIEVSGGVSLERLAALASLGVDYISMGALTHSAPAADISLEIVVE